MAQNNITYIDKVTSNPQPSIPDENKVTGDDMTEIKTVVNDNATDTQTQLDGKLEDNTVAVQTTRPLKTVNLESLEGIGNITIGGGTITNGNGTTANGNAVDLGGTTTDPILVTGENEVMFQNLRAVTPPFPPGLPTTVTDTNVKLDDGIWHLGSNEQVDGAPSKLSYISSDVNTLSINHYSNLDYSPSILFNDELTLSQYSTAQGITSLVISEQSSFNSANGKGLKYNAATDYANITWATDDDSIAPIGMIKDNTVQHSVTGEPTGSDPVLNMVSLTQAEYDAGTPIATTLYIITDA